LNIDDANSRDAHDGNALDSQIHAQLIALLFEQQVSSAVANLLVSSVFLFLVWTEVSHPILLSWYALHLAMVALRLYSRQRFKTRDPLPGDERRWGRISAVFSGLVGASWGLCALLFIDPAHPQAYIALSIIVTGFAAGSVTALSPYFPAFLAHVIPSMGGLALALVMTGDVFAYGIAALVIAGFIGYTPASRNVNQVLTRSARLGFENLALRQRAEERSKLLRTVLETMSQGLLVENRERKPLLWNDRLLHMLGAEPGEDRTDTNALKALLVRVGMTPEPEQGDTTQLRLDNGRVIEVMSSQMQDGGAVTTFSDITPLVERERAEEAARIAAERANAAKTRFLAAASHDLRQPIHALGLFVDALAADPGSTRAPQILNDIRDSRNVIDSMLGSLLDISKLDAGVVRPNLKDFSASELSRSIVRELRQQAELAGLSLRLHAPREAMAHGDPAMLARILRNLAQNAVRYTESGGVLLAVRARGDQVHIDVVDTGIGIPEGAQDIIFQEFQQLGNPQRDRRQGLGLGLAIVARLATLLDLDVRIRSRSGRGSCFGLSVPRARQAVATAEPTPTVTRLSASALNALPVLIIDDDREVLKAMGLVLTQWNCQAQLVADLDEAMQLIANGWRPRLLIVDYRLPGIRDGIIAVERLREALGSVPALLITGDTGPEHLKRAEKSALPLLHKPVQAEHLRQQVLELLAR